MQAVVTIAMTANGLLLVTCSTSGAGAQLDAAVADSPSDPDAALYELPPECPNRDEIHAGDRCPLGLSCAYLETGVACFCCEVSDDGWRPPPGLWPFDAGIVCPADGGGTLGFWYCGV